MSAPTAFGVHREESVVPFVYRRNILLLAAGAAAVLAGPGLLVASGQAAAEQSPAAELIKRTAGRVLETDFDLNYMVRTALGNHWNQATPDQRERFLKAAANAEAHAYARRFGQYGGQTLSVDPSMPRVRSDGVSIVNSTLTQTDDEPVAIQWEVHNAGQGARIVDVRIGGVSMLVTRRAEYNSFIQAQGGKVEPLINELEARAKR